MIRIVVGIVGIVLVMSLILAQFSGPETACTKNACGCPPAGGEVECNECRVAEPIISSWIVDVARSCPATEIIVCQGSLNLGRRVDVGEGCQFRVMVFRAAVFWL